MTLSEETKKYIADKLSPLIPIFAKASIGDFSQDVEIPEEDNEFLEVYTGIKVMLDVIRQKIVSLETEIEERKKTDERLQRVLDTMIEGFQIIGFDWKYQYVNDAAAKQGQRSKDDLIGRTMMEIYPNIDKTEMFHQLKRCMDDRKPHQMENEFVFPDGTKGWFELRMEPIIEGVFILSVDITERKRNQEQLGRLASIVKSSNDAIIGKDLEGYIAIWNPAAQRLYGYSEQEIIGSSISRIFPQDKKIEFENIMNRIRRGENVDYFETKRLRKDGKTVDVAVTVSPIMDANGKVIGASDIGRDISGKKRQEEELARLAAIVASSEDAIIGKNIDGVITTWNHGAEKLYGYTEAEMIGKSNSILIPPDRSHEWGEFIQKLNQGETIKNYETVRVHKDGRKIDVSITFSPIKDSTGRIIGSSAIVRDITEQKKVDTMKNEFVALASHQLKTPLTSIKWYSELLLKNMNTSSLTAKQIEYLHTIHKSNKRMIYLIDALLNVSRIDLGTYIVKPVASKLFELIDGVLEDYSMQLSDRDIHLERHYGHNIPVIMLDENVMRIILSNLILNAIRYSPRNGKVTIALTSDEHSVHISIEDHGIGIPASEQEKIFKKFSRADNAMMLNTDGSGLGLYMVKSLIDQTGGSITFTSEENKGTTFMVTFPLSGMKEKKGTRQLQ